MCASRQTSRRIGLADRRRGVQIFTLLGGQTQTNREAGKLWNEKADTQTRMQTDTMKDTQMERNGGGFWGPLSTLSILGRCCSTLLLFQSHTAKRSSAYPGMPGWVPSGNMEKQHAAFECFYSLTHAHTQSTEHTQNRKKQKVNADICYWLEFRQIYLQHVRT